VLLGPSGCGKSTLLKAVAGFVPPAEGEIRLEGSACASAGPDRIVVFQEFDQLPPWKTVKQNVMFPLRQARGMSKAEAATWPCISDKVGWRLPMPIRTLSGGMKQRVAIARAGHAAEGAADGRAVCRARCLTRRMQEELLALWDDAAFTLLFVTHSIEEHWWWAAASCCCRRIRAACARRLNSHQFTLASQGSAEFQQAAQRIHGCCSTPPKP
jgi:NitT/TauT family transport system ATP-binding protein